MMRAIAATVIFAFIATWNEFLFAQFLTGITSKTVSRAVWSGFGEAVSSFKILDFDELNTGSSLALAPTLILIFLIKKYLAAGVSLGTAR